MPSTADTQLSASDARAAQPEPDALTACASMMTTVTTESISITTDNVCSTETTVHSTVEVVQETPEAANIVRMDTEQSTTAVVGPAVQNGTTEADKKVQHARYAILRA